MGNWNYDARGYEEVTATNVKRLFDNVEYDNYNATEYGCQAIIDEWQPKADRFDQRFKNIPGYVEGQHCIVLKYAWLRETNKTEIKNFSKYLNLLSKNLLTPALVNGMDRLQYEKESNFLWDVLYKAGSMPANIFNYHELKRYKERYLYVSKVLEDIPYLSDESVTKQTNLSNLSSDIYGYTDQLIDEQMENTFKFYFPEAKIRKGQKTSKAIKKLCHMLGLDTDSKWEKEYARYADAINPLQIDKNVCISWNLYDYLTMSQGNSWASCHDINDCGCYSSGTISYATDNTSVVVYMLPDDYAKNPQPLWNIPKVKRQMFHIRADGNLFIQGRLYPDDQTDHGYGCEFDVYENWRHMMQEIVAKAFELNNLWKIKKGNDVLEDYIYHDGTNYPDYFHYNNCNMSYLSEIEDKIELQIIHIGHDAICPSCGEEHEETGCCTCDDCRDNKVVCADCGHRVYRDNAHEVDGEWYCDGCVSYCEYHEEYEHDNNMTYINDYGDVCEYGIDMLLDNGDIRVCKECGEYVLTDNAITFEEEENGEVFDFCSRYCCNRYCTEHYPRMTA